MPKPEMRLSAQELLEELPTLVQSFVAFAESLEPLDLNEVQEFLTDPVSKDILLAAQDFKDRMKPILERRAGLH